MINNLKQGFRENVVYALFSNYYKFLEVVERNISTYEGIRIEGRFSKGLVYTLIKDSKILGLTANGGKPLHLTELGNRWLKNFKDNDGRIDNALLKEACMNVPLFNKTLFEYPNIIDFKKLVNVFRLFAPKDIESKYLGMAVRRYLEGMHGMKLKQGTRPFSLEEYKIDNQSKNIESNEDFKRFIVIYKEIQSLPMKEAIKKYGKNKVQIVFNELEN